jgi:hypothetical protein
MKEPASIANPYPGLKPFEFDEQHLFFGREGQSEELIRRLGRSYLLAVVGTSGSGKSSLVRAGLLPLLYGGYMVEASSSWHIAMFRPGDNPIRNMALALNNLGVFEISRKEDEENQPPIQEKAVPTVEQPIKAALIETILRRSAIGLVDFVRQSKMQEHERLLIVVDQFEELFRFKKTGNNLSSEDEAAAFVKLLLEATRGHSSPIYVVLTMRSDFLGDCAQFRDLPEAINKGQYLIPRMTRDQLREAITCPAAVYGATLTPRLVNRLLNDVGDNPDQLPILQHALMRTWDHWTSNRNNGDEIDLADYRDVGEMTNALSDHADEAFSELPDERSKLVCARLFKCLTEKGPDNREIRRPTKLRDICAVIEASEEEVISVIDVFRQEGRSFLMPPVDVMLDANSVIDISHESLIRGWQQLKAWVNEEAESARTYRRLADDAVLHEQGKVPYWRDPALQLALDWRKQQKPNQAWAQRYHPAFESAMTFLKESRLERIREVKDKKRQKKEQAAQEQRALEQAQQLAELERKRAGDKAKSARRLWGLVFLLGLMLLLAVITTVIAVVKQKQAIAAQSNAEERRIEAGTQRNLAARSAAEAQAQTILAKLSARGESDAKDRAETEAKRASQQALLAQRSERGKAEALAKALKAEKQAKDNLKKFEEASEKDSLNKTALALSQRYEIEEAERTFNKLLGKYGVDKEGQAGQSWVRYNLGDLYRKLERNDEAVGHYENALDNQKKAYGDESPESIGVLNNLAKTLRTQRNYKGAITRYEQLVRILDREMPGKTDKLFKLNAANIHYELGGLYKQQLGAGQLMGESHMSPTEEHETAEKLRKQIEVATKIFEEVLAPDKYALAKKLKDVAGLYASFDDAKYQALNERAQSLEKAASSENPYQAETPSFGDLATVNTVLPAEGTGYTTYGREPYGTDQYGQASTIQAIQELGSLWASKYPQIRLAFGDISRKGGGSPGSTRDHKDGRAVDIRPLTNNGVNQPTNVGAENYSHELTKELVKMIKDKFPGAVIIFNDPILVSEGLTKRAPGHDNQLHVRFN